MSGPRSPGRAALAALLLLLFVVPAEATEPPRRVVSTNVCTDQLALMLADREQLVSVSILARDPAMSLMLEEAAGLPLNHGRAEEVFLLDPDLVLAGSFATQGTNEMLERLGIRVERFAPAGSFADIRESIARMGDLLGHPERARRVVAALGRDLARWRDAAPRRPLAAPYEVAGVSSGAGTLADDVVAAAGYDNLARRLGLEGMAPLPLEMLVMADPDLLIVSDRDLGGPALADEALVHPALLRAFGPRRRVRVDGRTWMCGTPLTARAVATLARHRRASARP